MIIQAPRSPVSDLASYRPAYDVTGVDIFPIAYPPAQHSDGPNRDISVVGDMAKKMAEASTGKPVRSAALNPPALRNFNPRPRRPPRRWRTRT